MNERIKQIRKSIGLTQTEFGIRIGVKGNTVTGYETGLRAPSDAIIKAISREFGINEEWLRTGEGEMSSPQEDEDAAYVEELLTDHDSPFYDLIRGIMKSYLELSAQDQDAVKRFAAGLKENMGKKKEGKD